MKTTEKSIYIIGAGFAGQMLASEIKRKKFFGNVAAFIDDEISLHGKEIDGVPVLGPIEKLMSFLRISRNDEAIIALPGVQKERIKEIYTSLKAAGFSGIKILPALSQIVEGSAHLIQTREINPLDVLGRTPVHISLKKSLAYLRNKRVLITGAGGSIGSELARQLLHGGAQRLYLFGHGENSIYQIYKELNILQKEGVGEKAIIVPVIGDLKNRDYMHYILPKLKCDVIFHCAAYKHVPLMEENPVAVIENNVFGTKNLIDAAIFAGVSRFVLISTDKAVEPISVYGVSKMLCEKLVIEGANDSKVLLSKNNAQDSAYMFVRFGNVLGSRGSILPLFTEQLKTGGPLTITHPDMKRYFMTIPEACSLVLQTGGVGKNGVPYLLDMGEPIKIVDLARQFIQFSLVETNKEVDITFIGPRAGERLEEPLWTADENPTPTEYPKILSLQYKKTPFDLTELLEKLKPICMYTDDHKDLYRSKEALMNILYTAFPFLKDFHHE